MYTLHFFEEILNAIAVICDRCTLRKSEKRYVKMLNCNVKLETSKMYSVACAKLCRMCVCVAKISIAFECRTEPENNAPFEVYKPLERSKLYQSANSLFSTQTFLNKTKNQTQNVQIGGVVLHDCRLHGCPQWLVRSCPTHQDRGIRCSSRCHCSYSDYLETFPVCPYRYREQPSPRRDTNHQACRRCRSTHPNCRIPSIIHNCSLQRQAW